MDNYSENIRPGWNYPEAKQVKALGLSPIQTQVLHASCKFEDGLKVYRKGYYGLVKSIGLQGVECNREQAIKAIRDLVDLGFIYVRKVDTSDAKPYITVYHVEADFQKIRGEYNAKVNNSALF